MGPTYLLFERAFDAFYDAKKRGEAEARFEVPDELKGDVFQMLRNALDDEAEVIVSEGALVMKVLHAA